MLPKGWGWGTCAAFTCGSPNSRGVVVLPPGPQGQVQIRGLVSARSITYFAQFQQHNPASLRGVAGYVSCVTQSSPASSSLLSASSFLDALPFAKRGAFLMVGEKEK